MKPQTELHSSRGAATEIHGAQSSEDFFFMWHLFDVKVKECSLYSTGSLASAWLPGNSLWSEIYYSLLREGTWGAWSFAILNWSVLRLPGPMRQDLSVLIYVGSIFPSINWSCFQRIQFWIRMFFFVAAGNRGNGFKCILGNGGTCQQGPWGGVEVPQGSAPSQLGPYLPKHFSIIPLWEAQRNVWNTFR